jgi:haloacetate dehalogenase
VPEQLIASAPDVLVNHMLDTWSDAPEVFPPDIRNRYLAQFHSAETVHAICEQYRAAATLDYQHDEADRGSRRITCPTLVLWSATGAVAYWYEPIEIWKTGPTRSREHRSRPAISSPRKLPTTRLTAS